MIARLARRAASHPAAPLIAIALALAVKLARLSNTLDPQPFPAHRAVLLTTVAVIGFMWTPLVLFAGTTTSHVVACLLNVALTTLALADHVHYRFFGDVLSLSDSGRLGQIGVALPSLLYALGPRLALAYFDVVLALLLLPAVRRRAAPATARARIRWCLALVLMSSLSGSPSAYLLHTDPEEIFHYTYTRQQVVAAIGILPYHAYDVALVALYPWRGRLASDHHDLRAVQHYLAELPARSAASSPLFGAAYHDNVILIQAESLQAFVLDLRIGDHEVTPHLNRFAAESLRFTNFFDQAHLGTTADAELLALQSLHPIRAAAIATRYASNTFHGLPAILGEHGYTALSAVGEPGRVWNMGPMHERLGFEVSLFQDAFAPGERFGPGVPDEPFFREAVARLKALGQPYFAFLVTLTNHHPYRLPPEHVRLDVGDLGNTLLGDYLTSVHYFDRAFGAFLEAMQSANLLDDTVIALYGDHHGYLDSPPELRGLVDWSGDPAYGDWLLQKRLPFLVRMPGGGHAGEQAGAGGQLDVAPTLLGLLGIDDRVGLGRDLTASADRVVAFRAGGFLSGDTHCMPDRRRGSSVRCFSASSLHPVPVDVAAESRAARTLEISDRIVTGNLLAALRPEPPPRRTAPLVIGHRGSPRRAPENTESSIAAAIEDGADAVEIDVRLTADGVPVVIHDPTLELAPLSPIEVAQTTLAELQDHTVHLERFGMAEAIPTLAAVLQRFGREIRFLLDVPVAGMAARIAQVYAAHGVPASTAIVGTWSLEEASDYLAHLPGATVLTADTARIDWDPAGFAKFTRAGISGVEVWADGHLPAGYVAAAHAAGLLVFTYTVNDAPAMRHHLNLGVDGIETDVPAVLRRVVDARGDPGR